MQDGGAPRDLAFARSIIVSYVPRGPEDRAAQEQILAFVDRHADALHRTCLEGHLTASALLLDASGERCLLHHHRKLDRWLQFGGHADGDGDLARVAWREVHEESGIEPARLGPVPVDLDVHAIPARGDEPEHLHLDVRYLAHAPAGAVEKISHESKALEWMSPEEALERTTSDSLGRVIAFAMAARS